MNKFTNDLHADLFDDLIICLMGLNPHSDPAHHFRDVLETTSFFRVMKDIVGQENHPEEFVRYVSDHFVRDLIYPTDMTTRNVMVDRQIIQDNKIKITIMGEE